MSRSFALENGDLVINNRQYATVTGKKKLAQDLALHVLEKIGTDPATPAYGSTLDGGQIGNERVEGFIGTPLTEAAKNAIVSEVLRVIQGYHALQVQRVKEETVAFGVSSLTQDELIASIESVTAKHYGDIIVVTAIVRTLGNESVRVTLPVSL